MEQNFQTSFIPKKPIVEDTSSSRPVSFFLIISIFIFFSVLIAYGGLYFYKGITEKSITQKQEDLKKAEARFEVEKIKLLKNLDKKLIASKEVLAGHIAISPIFKDLEAITMKTVRFTKFSYSLENNQKINVNLSGMAVGYRSVALQADLFAKNKNFIDPVFSNLTLDEKGNVIFDLTFSVDPTFVDFEQTIKVESAPVLPSVTNGTTLGPSIDSTVESNPN